MEVSDYILEGWEAGAFKECGRCRLDLREVRDGHLKMCLVVRG